jgi:CheY-like chemotaxis protein/anti-sigma regulatory factor (Ser/Thr protein kinase)
MHTVLVVDDSQVDRRLVGGLLVRAADIQVVYAEHGIDALERMELDVPDLVVTDIHMPEMNGLEFVEAAKKLYPMIPVVLMTAQGSEELAVEALKRGAASYVSKRRLGEDLVSTVLHVLDALQVNRGQSRLMNRIERSETRYILPNDTELVQVLVQQVRATLTSMRVFAENDHLRIGIAFEEAMLNSLYHGNLEVSSELRDNDHAGYERLAKERASSSPFRERTLLIDIVLTSESAQFKIRDEGPGFDPQTLPDPTDPEYLERPSGRGVLLMKSFMDKVTYNDSGNEVTMTKVVTQNPVLTEEVEVS